MPTLPRRFAGFSGAEVTVEATKETETTRKFETEIVLSLADNRLDERSGLTLVETEELDRRRWVHSRGYTLNDRSDNTFWWAEIEFPNTECQEVEREEHIEFTRVYPKQKTITVTVYEETP